MTEQSGTLSKRLRILFLTPEMPAATGGGLSMRCGQNLLAASAIGDVDVIVAASQDKSNPQSAAFTQHHARRLIVVESDGRFDSMLEIILYHADPSQGLEAFRSYGRPAMCLGQSAPVLRDVGQALAGQSYDLCIVMRLHRLPTLDAALAACDIGTILCDLDDDDEWFAQERSDQARRDGDDFKAQMYKAEADIYREFRIRMATKAAVLTVAGQQSLDRLSAEHGSDKVRLVPNGIRMAAPDPPAPDPVLLFVGSLNYEPNTEGLDWFVQQVLPLVQKSVPEVALHVAGRSASKNTRTMLRRARATLFDGPPDLEPIYRQAAVSIVPLHRGSGTRIKILEAGAYGLPIVSTEKGAEGIGLSRSVHGWITPETPGAFADACIEALSEPDMRAEQAGNLRQFVSENHDLNLVIGRMQRIIDDVTP